MKRGIIQKMNQNRSVRFLPMIIILIVVAVVIAALVSIGRAVFSGNSVPETTQVDAARSSLLKTDDSRSVVMVVRGPIVAQENFKSYRVRVSPTQRSIDVYNGYLRKLNRSKTLSNNEKAYEQFVYALDKANMTKARTSGAGDDLRGICASGYVYEFRVVNQGDTVDEFWTSTCDGSKGNLGADKDQLAGLFLEQVPGSEDYIPFESNNLLRF